MIVAERLFEQLPAARRPGVHQFIGYLAVSGTAFLVDFSIYWALLKPMHFAAAAAVGGYVAGVLVHYTLSSRIVFANVLQARGLRSEAPVVVRFFAAGCTGLVITALTVGILADGFGVSPLMAKLVATSLSSVCVFTALRFFVFQNADNTPATG